VISAALLSTNAFSFHHSGIIMLVKLSQMTACIAVLCAASAFAEEAVITPRPVPLTRPEMKQLLEDMKSRPLRIPIPELTDEDKAQLGERGTSYESLLRYFYMPPGEPSTYGGASIGGRGTRGANSGNAPGNNAASPPRDFTRNADDQMSLSYPFKTRLFWIVSRTNNCQYCLGHQEQKLASAGMTDDEIAALDFDWELFPVDEQAAFAYARKLTYEPHRLCDEDIAALRKHYTELQILEMTMSVAWNNSINRWKEGAGVPQSQTGLGFFRRGESEPPKDRALPIESFVTPTSKRFESALSRVAAVARDPKTGAPTKQAISKRPPLESRNDVEAALTAARTRASRLPLVSEDDSQTALGDLAPSGPLPAWFRLMANFPNDARGRIRGINALVDDRGDLTPLLKAQVSWIIARQDRAWYAAGLVQQRLRQLGQTNDQIYALDGDWEQFSAADRSLFKFARRLAATPVALTDSDIAESLKLTSPLHVVQLINFVTSRAYFDRVTEAAGLPLD